jgi:hypothetical protein
VPGAGDRERQLVAVGVRALNGTDTGAPTAVLRETAEQVGAREIVIVARGSR